MKTSKCKGCGKEIVFAENLDTGKAVPLDPTPAVYLVMEVGGEIVAHRRKDCMVSHFTTCPNASDFSGGKK